MFQIPCGGADSTECRFFIAEMIQILLPDLPERSFYFLIITGPGYFSCCRWKNGSWEPTLMRNRVKIMEYL